MELSSEWQRTMGQGQGSLEGRLEGFIGAGDWIGLEGLGRGCAGCDR